MIHRSISSFVCFCILMVSSTVRANNPICGKALLDTRLQTADAGNREGKIAKSISRLDLEARTFIQDSIGLVGEVWITYDNLDSFRDQIRGEKSVDPNRPDYDVIDLRQAYASVSWGPTDFRAGQMILNWGRTDELNPVDVINSEDFSEFYSIEKEERKKSVLLLNGLLHLDNATIEAVWIPFFEPSVVPDKGIWAPRRLTKYESILPPGQYDNLDYDNDKHSTSRSEVGVRFSGICESLDWGMVYFHGSNDLPVLTVELDPLGQVTSSIEYKRFHGFGLDFSYAFSGYSLRGEVFYRDSALFLLETLVDGLNNYESASLQSVLGIDKTLGEDFYVNAQLMHHRIMDFHDQSIADKDTFLGMLDTEYQLMDNDLKLVLKSFYGFNEKDWMVNPYAEYSITDNLQVQPGVYLYGGPQDSDMGQFDGNDMVYGRICYFF